MRFRGIQIKAFYGEKPEEVTWMVNKWLVEERKHLESIEWGTFEGKFMCFIVYSDEFEAVLESGA